MHLCYNRLGDDMHYLKEITVHQIEISKSIFITILYPLSDTSDIEHYLADAKLKYPKANHYCYASIFGPQGEQSRASDDGEPQRTAGIPILEVLKHHNVSDVLCVVIRYFGGIKLGSGGLVRAYTKACADTLKHSTFYEKRIVPSYELTFDYAFISTLDHVLKEKATIIEKHFLEVVTYIIVLNEDDPQFLDEMLYQLKSIKALPSKTIHIESL